MLGPRLDAALRQFADRGADAGDLRPPLLLGTAMLAFRVALDRWTDRGGAVPARAVLEEALDAVTSGATALQRTTG